MALWLVRTGRHGQHEQRFLDDNRVYMNWGGVKADLSAVKDNQDVLAVLSETLPDESTGTLRNGAAQMWAFVGRMAPGDWVVVPSRKRPAIHIAEIISGYHYDPNAPEGYYHSRDVKWIETDIPRSNFDQDLLYSFGAFMTICQIKRNDAERRVRAMASHGWKSSSAAPTPRTTSDTGDDDNEDEAIDLERLAKDQIARLIIARFKGHGLARLVDAILQAQGYTTFVSPEGPDKGIDILAAPGPLGFGQPRICVQVKSGDGPVDRPTLDQLIGAMQNVQADQRLFVSWGGFKSSVEKEVPAQFFRVRLWNQDTLIEQLLEHYHELDEELRAELPLKRVWMVAEHDGEE